MTTTNARTPRNEYLSAAIPPVWIGVMLGQQTGAIMMLMLILAVVSGLFSVHPWRFYVPAGGYSAKQWLLVLALCILAPVIIATGFLGLSALIA